MDFASTSTVVVRAIKEDVFGVTPTTGVSRFLRITGETLKAGITKEASEEINADRGVSSMIPVTANATGALNHEMYAAGLDDFLESCLQSTWSEFGVGGETASVNIAFTATTLTAGAAPTGANAFTNLQRGQWFRVEGSVNNDGKILRVSPVVSPTTTVITLDASTPATIEASVAVKLQSRRLTHGRTKTSWSLERENSDVAAFLVYRGMTPSKFSLSIQSGSRSTINFDFMGRDALESDDSLLPVATPSPANEIHSGVSGAMMAVWENGAPLTGTYVKSITMDFDNALRSQEAIGYLGAVGIGSGTIQCTLTISTYFASNAQFNRFRRNLNNAYIFGSTDPEGNGYIFTVPNANISDYTSNASAKDQDQMIELQVTALLDSKNPVAALRKLLFIDRVGAPTVIPALAPTNTTLPSITGTAETGELLTAVNGVWTGYPVPTFAYQWRRDGVSIGGATSGTYTVVIADEGTKLSVTVTATNTEGSISATSLETATVVP